MSTRKRKAKQSNSGMFKGTGNSKKKKAASGSDESAWEKMFLELADAEDPTVIGMEGMRRG